jgi:hypothetical protein
MSGRSDASVAAESEARRDLSPGVLHVCDAGYNRVDDRTFRPTYEDGLPVLYKLLVSELPAPAVAQTLPWLTIISWDYDGSGNNGMPPEPVHDRMMALEETISTGLERDGFLVQTCSRTGNNLKELYYYINDRDAFIEAFNGAVAGQDRYPIEITFYEDPKWQDLQEVLHAFSGGS